MIQSIHENAIAYFKLLESQVENNDSHDQYSSMSSLFSDADNEDQDSNQRPEINEEIRRFKAWFKRSEKNLCVRYDHLNVAQMKENQPQVMKNILKRRQEIEPTKKKCRKGHHHHHHNHSHSHNKTAEQMSLNRK